MNIPAAEIIEADRARHSAPLRLSIELAEKILRYTLGLVLLGAAVLKVSSLSDGFGASTGTLLEALFIPGTELGVALWLLSGVAEAWSRRAVMLLLVVFIVAVGRRLLAGNSDCGCFGAFRVPPALTLAFDLTSLAALYLLGRAGAATRNRRPSDDAARRHCPKQTRAVAALGAVFVAVALTALRFAGVHGTTERVVVLDPASWRGKPFPMLAYVDARAVGDLATGNRTVILFNGRCEACGTYLARISREKSSSEAAVTRLMDVAPIGRRGRTVSFPPFLEVPLMPGNLYAVDVPLEVSLADGVVVGVRHAE